MAARRPNLPSIYTLNALAKSRERGIRERKNALCPERNRSGTVDLREPLALLRHGPCGLPLSEAEEGSASTAAWSRSTKAGPALSARGHEEKSDGFDLESDNHVLFLDRFSPEKNHDLLIQAFESVDTDMKVALAGGSSHTVEYFRKLRSHSSERIKFLGWLSGCELREVLANAAFFVLPSDMEGLWLA